MVRIQFKVSYLSEASALRKVVLCQVSAMVVELDVTLQRKPSYS